MTYYTKKRLPAVCCAGLMLFITPAAFAGIITAGFSGVFSEVLAFGTPEFAVGDEFHVVVGYDSDATLLGQNCASIPAPLLPCDNADFNPGALYAYDPSSLFFDVTIGGITTRFGDETDAVSALPGLDNLLWYRDNSGDRILQDGFGPSDGLSFRKSALFADNSAYLISLVLRTSDTSAVSGAALPTDPRSLLGGEIAGFSIQTADNFFTFEGFQGGEGPLSVPAPSTLLLVVLGFFGLRVHRGSYKRYLP